jgi:N-methylhydantoinase B
MEEGGSGAKKGYDGWDGMCSTPLAGVVTRGSVEICEYFMPIMWHVAEIGTDREGPGEFMGSRGVIGDRENVGPPGSLLILMSGDASGQKFSPKGVAGAPQVPLGELEILNPGKTEKEPFRTMDMQTMAIGARLFTNSHGGSGWGDPLDRDPEKVRKDVRDQYISIERARDVYGVVFSNDGSENPEETAVDLAATVKLRKEKKALKQKEVVGA